MISGKRRYRKLKNSRDRLVMGTHKQRNCSGANVVDVHCATHVGEVRSGHFKGHEEGWLGWKREHKRTAVVIFWSTLLFNYRHNNNR